MMAEFAPTAQVQTIKRTTHVAVFGTAPGLPVVHSGRIPAGCDPGADGGRCLGLPEIPILLLNFAVPAAWRS
jgi:hypothetical protein